MKSFAFLVCFSFMLAVGVISAASANPAFEKVKPFTFQVVEVPVVSSGYVDTEYNLKPNLFNCSENKFGVDPELLGIFKDYQKVCTSSYKQVIDSYESLCLISQLFETPLSRSKSVEQVPNKSHPEEPSFSADRIDTARSKRGKRALDRLTEKKLEAERKSVSYEQKLRFLMLSMEIERQYRKALYLTFKLKDLSLQLITRNLWAEELLDIFDFSSLTNVTKFAKFHKFKNCNPFNEVDSTFKVKLLEANVIPTKQIIQLDAFRYLDSQGCLVSYVGPELFVYDSSNQTYCPLQSSLFEFANENKPLDDGCQPFIEPDLLFHRNCSAQLDPKNLIQVKDYGQFYQIYCYGSEVKFNDDAPIKCPNSVLRTSVNNTVFINGRILEVEDQLDRAVKLDDETNQKLIQVFKQTITTNLTMSG